MIRHSSGALAVLAVVLVIPAATRAATLETSGFRFRLADDSGAWQLTDRRSSVTWRSNPERARFGQVRLAMEGQERTVDLVPFRVDQRRHALILDCRPSGDSAVRLQVTIAAGRDGTSIEFSYQAEPQESIKAIHLLEGAFPVTALDSGAILVPTREGLLIPADSGLAFTHRFDTSAYEGCHLQMLGFLRQESAALVTWDDPYVAAEVRSRLTVAAPAGDGSQMLTTSLELRQSARAVRLQLLGPGDAVAIAKAYRRVAQDRGLVVTWDRKIRQNPERAKFLGATNYKLWSTLDRRMNEASTQEREVRVNWTFDEAARVAEHLRQDLGLERVLFGMGGWIHRGYDNQHPDILPAAPECGGDSALADCARRVMAQGYLLALHDNYQDLYRDAPSWDERWLNRNRDGSLTTGGAWAGGRAYITCARMALELARRPQNLPAVYKLTRANSYFIDTTYASGLYECFESAHPMTRADDLHWKAALSDYARDLFGTFGSECGREWAIPHADFFEGLTGVSGRGFHDAGLEKKLGASILPLFELVYRDCIAAYGKYGYDPAHAADYVLQHIALGRPLHHHNVPPHLYWTQREEDLPLALTPTVERFEAVGGREFEIAYRWEVRQPASGPWRVFVHFTDPTGDIAFQNDHQPPTPVSQWPPGSQVVGPFRVRVPDRAAGPYEAKIGLFDPATGRRARLAGPDSSERNVRLGTLRVTSDGLRWDPETVSPAPRRDPALFTRGDGGWTAGLHPFDRFVKNTHEILSPLHELTGRLPMTAHEFLDPARLVQHSVFGSGPSAYQTVVNGGPSPISRKTRQGGVVTLPPGGFLIDGPRFAAFLATEWGGRTYPDPALFTVRSTDGRPLERSRAIRVFHAFGDSTIRLHGRDQVVPREALLRR